MAVQLSASYLRRSYQLLAGLRTDRMSGEEAFEKASDLIYAWGRRKKFYRIFRQLPYQKATLEDRRDGNEIGVIYEPEQGNFIFRAAHPDTGVPGRMWITDVQLRRSGEDCLFAVRLSATSLQSCGEEVPFSVPGFVRRVMEEVGLTDVAQLSGQSTLLSTREEVSGFLQFLEDPGRRLPVILLTPCYSPGDGPWGGYLMDAAAMAADTSPSNPLGVSTPMGPIITCAHLVLKITAFSPVAPSSAPARSMAAVARELVPTARRCSAGQRFFTASTSPRPIPPPCPSMISTRIASRFIRFVPPVVHGSIDAFHYTGSPPPASTAERHRRSLFSGAGLRPDRKSGKLFSKA